MQSFLYFLEGLNEPDQKDFYQSILNVMREATVKNFSLQFESSKEIFSDVNIKPLWDTEEMEPVCSCLCCHTFHRGAGGSCLYSK